LREVFGDARLAADSGPEVEQAVDLTPGTRPSFAAWRDNAECFRDKTITPIDEDPRWRRARPRRFPRLPTSRDMFLSVL